MLTNPRLVLSSCSSSHSRLTAALAWKSSSGAVVAGSALASLRRTWRRPSGGSAASMATAAASDGDAFAPLSTASHPLPHMRSIMFCEWCGAATKESIPDGDDKTRSICTGCGKVYNRNLKMVVGCVVENENKILLCQRKIHPSYGLWCLPSGYLELGESAFTRAVRETREKAGAEVEVTSPFAQLDIPAISQSYYFFRARMRTPNYAPGAESLDCRFYAPEDIPFSSLAFNSMVVSLNFYIEDLKIGRNRFHYCTINKRPGSDPSDIHAYTLEDLLEL